MNSLCIFLNTRIEQSGTLVWIGDKGVAPFRYLFNGKTIRVQASDSDQEIKIHPVPSSPHRTLSSAGRNGIYNRLVL